MVNRDVKSSQTDPFINFEKLPQTEANGNLAAIIDNSDENLSHLLPTQNKFQLLNQTGSCDIPMKQCKLVSCPVSLSLVTISNLNPSNNSMVTTTSKNPNISTSEDHLSPSEEMELYNMLQKFAVKVDAMTLKCQDISEELKKK